MPATREQHVKQRREPYGTALPSKTKHKPIKAGFGRVAEPQRKPLTRRIRKEEGKQVRALILCPNNRSSEARLPLRETRTKACLDRLRLVSRGEDGGVELLAKLPELLPCCKSINRCGIRGVVAVRDGRAASAHQTVRKKRAGMTHIPKPCSRSA